MSAYRIAAEREPAPKRSWWCRLGLHRWDYYRLSHLFSIVYMCGRDGCSAESHRYNG